VTTTFQRNSNDLLQEMDPEQIKRDLAQQNIIIWTDAHIRTEKGVKMEYHNRPYLPQIMEDFSDHIVVTKSAQVGLTQTSIVKSLFVADTGHRTIIYTFPTKGDVMEFSKARFGAIIADSAYLSTRVQDTNSAELKKVGDSHIYFKGTFTERQGLSVPSDVNVHDELDFSDPNVRDVYSSRLDVSDLAWEWDFSTPTIPNYGIDALWQKSDKHVWRVICRGCGKDQQISFFKNIFRKKGHPYYWGCRKCEKTIDRSVGRWEAKYPKRHIRGYYVPQSICGVIKAGKLKKVYKDAPNKPLGMKKFFNYNLGKPYESGDTSLTRKLILDRVVPGTVEQGKIFFGVDQGDVLHLEITKEIDGRRIVVGLHKLHSFKELEDMLKYWKPSICAIDALPNHQNALDLAKVYPNVIVVYYDTGMKTRSLDKDTWTDDLKKSKVSVPRTEAMDHTASLWQRGLVSIEHHIGLTSIEEFAVHMSNIKRDIVDDARTGQQKPIWKAVGPDHYRHADIYNWIAQQIASNSRSSEMATSGHNTSEVGFAGAVGKNLFDDKEIW